jgi:hypothetical protein
MSRTRLVSRIEAETRAYANAPRHRDSMQLGRVYGLLEAGVLEGHWRKRDADAAANLIENRYRISRVRDVLLRGDDVALWRQSDVASFLGVSAERVKQLVAIDALVGDIDRPWARLWRRRGGPAPSAFAQARDEVLAERGRLPGPIFVVTGDRVERGTAVPPWGERVVVELLPGDPYLPRDDRELELLENLEADGLVRRISRQQAYRLRHPKGAKR